MLYNIYTTCSENTTPPPIPPPLLPCTPPSLCPPTTSDPACVRYCLGCSLATKNWTDFDEEWSKSWTTCSCFPGTHHRRPSTTHRPCDTAFQLGFISLFTGRTIGEVYSVPRHTSSCILQRCVCSLRLLCTTTMDYCCTQGHANRKRSCCCSRCVLRCV